MTRRTAAQQAARIRRVTVGDHDVASRAAHAARIDLCHQKAPGDGPMHRHPLHCTRAAGHHEGTTRTSGSDHVAAGVGFVALAVWL